MKIEIVLVRIVRAELDETEFETVMFALERASDAYYTESTTAMRKRAQKLVEEFNKAFAPDRSS